MLRGHTLAKPVRRWGVIAAAGAIGFAIGIAGFARLGLDGIFRILNDLPAAAVGAGLSVMLALAGLAIAALFAVVRERQYGRAATVAIDNMTQGLSMFDGAARLVLCNSRYIEMSQLPPENFREGTPLREILIHRARAGNFAGDPDQYAGYRRIPTLRSSGSPSGNATRCVNARNAAPPSMRRSPIFAPASSACSRRSGRVPRP
jgi:PAS domain-containing protein